MVFGSERGLAEGQSHSSVEVEGNKVDCCWGPCHVSGIEDASLPPEVVHLKLAGNL